MRFTPFLIVLAVAACGADGAPIPPEPKKTETTKGPGVHLSGDARFGVTTK